MKVSRTEILALRRLLQAFVAQADDATASIMTAMSPKLPHDGKLIKAGTRVNVDGVVYKAAVDLRDPEANSPENAPTLWAKLSYRDGYRIIPNPVGGIFPTTEAFSDGERGWWGDKLMESTADGNCYTPEAYAGYWTEVSV